MNQAASLQKMLVRPWPAAAAYFGIVALLLFLIGSSLTDLLSRRADVAATAAMLDQLEGRGAKTVRGQGIDASAPSGSPFLEGATVTVAGAALLQRVSAVVTRLGGNVLSTQIDLQGSQSKAGFVTVIANCDLDQPSLQRLLYDLESGMPFLFIDQLLVQAPAGLGTSGDGKLRVLITVSGQWQGAK